VGIGGGNGGCNRWELKVGIEVGIEVWERYIVEDCRRRRRRRKKKKNKMK